VSSAVCPLCAPCLAQIKRMPIHIAVAASNGAAKEILLGRALETSMEFTFWEQGHWYPYDEAAARLLSFELGTAWASRPWPWGGSPTTWSTSRSSCRSVTCAGGSCEPVGNEGCVVEPLPPPRIPWDCEVGPQQQA